jgi:hypothetical protein
MSPTTSDAAQRLSAIVSFVSFIIRLKAKRVARHVGGMRSHGQYSMVVDSKAKAPQTAGELKALLAELTAGVLRGHVDPKVLEVVSRSATVQLQAIKIADIEQRLAQIEEYTK